MTREFYTGPQINCSTCGAGSGLFLSKQARKKGLCESCNSMIWPITRAKNRSIKEH